MAEEVARQKKLSIRKNDVVQVMSGSEKGKTGKVLQILVKDNTIMVEKIKMVKRHVKPSQQNPQGGYLEKEMPIQYSTVLIFCPKCNRGVRHGIKIEAAKTGKKTGSMSAKKTRFCKKCKGSLEAA